MTSDMCLEYNKKNIMKGVLDYVKYRNLREYLKISWIKHSSPELHPGNILKNKENFERITKSMSDLCPGDSGILDLNISNF
ncbi:hypothetical protein Glove_66g142 [Diversispora epigaea]|uniref:Uncharacterized protein n=1 Tax=Diversispora epigaea TaxID=1348612 RepID=A0A397JK94_9GLOM|nr:hypothetical protein Glove_66g142 [Diversispora epigaea]